MISGLSGAFSDSESLVGQLQLGGDMTPQFRSTGIIGEWQELQGYGFDWSLRVC